MAMEPLADPSRGDDDRALDELASVEETRYQLASPRFVAVLSALVMGLGQFYNGQLRAAKVFLATELCLALYVYDFWAGGEVSTTVIGWTSPVLYGFFMALLLGGGLLVWGYNVYDAWSAARFCEMIYDRTLPSLDDEQEQMVAARLIASTLGVEHHRGAWRQALFVVAAIFLYSGALFWLGSYFSRARHDLADLRGRLALHPDDAFSHLQLGELLVAEGDLLNAAGEFEKVTSTSSDPSLVSAAYSNLAGLHRRLGNADKADEMLQRALDSGRSPRRPAPAGAEGSPTTTDAGAWARLPLASATPTSTSSAAVAATPLPALEVQLAVEQARADVDLRRPDDALAKLAPLRERGELTPDGLALLARVHLARGERDLARDAVRAALARGPRDAQALSAAVAVAVAEGDPGRINDAARASLTVRSEDPAPVAVAARALLDLGRLEEAYALTSEALSRSPRDAELLQVAFAVARKQGLEDQAYQTALALADADVRDVGVQQYLAEEAARRGDLPRAIKCARGLTVMEPGQSRWLRLQGDLQARSGDYRAALESYRNALTVEPGNADVYASMAAVAASTRDHEAGVGYLRRALELKPGSAPLLKALAEQLRAAGRLDEAQQTLEQAQAGEPNSLDASYQAGLVALERDDPATAVARLKRVFTTAPTYQDVAFFYGRACEALGRLDEAVDAYRAVRPASSHAAEARECAERLAEGREDVPPATEPPAPPPRPGVVAVAVATTLPALAAVATAAPVSVDRYADRLKSAELAFREGRKEEALRLYGQVLQVHPQHERSLFQTGVILRELGRRDEALAALRSAKRARPDDLAVLVELGNLLADLERFDEAVAEFEEVVRLDPKHLAARYTLGWLFEKNKSYAKAEEHYKAIAWFYPEYTKAYDYLGNVCFVQGRYDEALRNFDKLLAVDADDAAVRFKAALTLLNLGDRDRARRELLFLKGTVGRDNPLRDKVEQYLAKLDR